VSGLCLEVRTALERGASLAAQDLVQPGRDRERDRASRGPTLCQWSLSFHQVFQFYGCFGLDQDCVWSRGVAKALMPATCQSVQGRDSMKNALSFAP